MHLRLRLRISRPLTALRTVTEGGLSLALQVGPRLSFQSAWSTNAVSICASCGLAAVTRLEQSRRFRLRAGRPLSASEVALFAALVRAGAGR
jgi:phosphoribosylformylglycinamidine synthase